MTWLRPLLWLLLVTPLAEAACQSKGARKPFSNLTAQDRVQIWIKDFRRAPAEHVRLEELTRILRHVESSVDSGELDQAQLIEALTHLCEVGYETRKGPWRPLGDRVIAKARHALGNLRTDELVDALASQGLVARDGEMEARIATSLLLAGETSRHVVSALLMNLRSEDRELRRAALEALAGRQDDLVHVAFIARLTQAEGDEAAWIEGHFANVKLGTTSRACEPLTAAATERILGEDWRTTVGGLRLARSLPDERAVPLLIQALELWNRRIDQGGPYRRVQDDVVRALEERSGRTIGRKPQRWRTWWRAKREGHTKNAEEGAANQRTTAGFFGLDAVSDRILFVIDRSGSMKSGMGHGDRNGRSRYEVASEQMLKFLEGLGPQTHFGIILFSDSVRSWNLDMVAADKGGLSRARKWLRSQSPNGGTLLRKGVERALGIHRGGRLDLEDLEVDTVIVLCDGATSEGPGWVQGFLAGAGGASRIKFHGIQIGGGGDGTLQALAEGTGGDYLVVNGS